MMRHPEDRRLPWQHLITIVIDKICKMTFKGLKLTSESFFSISYGVMEVNRKGADPPSIIRIGLRSKISRKNLKEESVLSLLCPDRVKKH